MAAVNLVNTGTGKYIPDVDLLYDKKLISVKTVTTDAYTVVSTDDFLNVTTTSTENCTITLPSAQALTAGRKITIKDSGYATLYNTTVTTEGSETIDGESSLVFGSGNCVSIVSDGANWITY